MGLDMYLYRRHYVKNWDHYKPNERTEVKVRKGGKPFNAIKPERVCYITEEVAYWRKANAIHKWFVDNVQGGKDDCGEYYVTREQLTELRDLCVQVLESTELQKGKVHNGNSYHPNGRIEEILEDGEVIVDSSKAEEILPTADGFFFGSTDYDQYYSQDIRETAEMLTAILSEPDEGDFVYHSSW